MRLAFGSAPPATALLQKPDPGRWEGEHPTPHLTPPFLLGGGCDPNARVCRSRAARVSHCPPAHTHPISLPTVHADNPGDAAADSARAKRRADLSTTSTRHLKPSGPAYVWLSAAPPPATVARTKGQTPAGGEPTRVPHQHPLGLRKIHEREFRTLEDRLACP